MGEHDLKKLKELLHKARRAGMEGHYLEQKALMLLIGKLLYNVAFDEGLQVKNTDTWDMEVIEI